MLRVLASIKDEKTLLVLQSVELKMKLSQIQERERRIRAEIESVEAQISYYDGLTKDMKKGVHPPKLHGLLDHMGKG
jgi:hypothetical protein